MATDLTPARRIARFVARLACAGVASLAAGWFGCEGYLWTVAALYTLAAGIGFVAVVDF